MWVGKSRTKHGALDAMSVSQFRRLLGARFPFTTTVCPKIVQSLLRLGTPSDTLLWDGALSVADYVSERNVDQVVSESGMGNARRLHQTGACSCGNPSPVDCEGVGWQTEPYFILSVHALANAVECHGQQGTSRYVGRNLAAVAMYGMLIVPALISSQMADLAFNKYVASYDCRFGEDAIYYLGPLIALMKVRLASSLRCSRGANDTCPTSCQRTDQERCLASGCRTLSLVTGSC